MSEIDFTVSNKFAFLSSIMYDVVPNATLFWSYPNDFPMARTAAIWVPPARITFVILDAVLSIPATKGIIGSPALAITSYGSLESERANAFSTTPFFNDCGFSGMLELTCASIPKLFKTASAVVVPPGTLSPIMRQSVDEASVLPSILP